MAQNPTPTPIPKPYEKASVTSEFLLRKYQGVSISSDHETSWMKHVGALPLNYFITENNLRIPNPNFAQLISDNETPNDLSDDIWKIACLRNVDGSMEVHSAATPKLGTGVYNDENGLPIPNALRTFWYGGGTFTDSASQYFYRHWDIGSNKDVHDGNPLVVLDSSQTNGSIFLKLGDGDLEDPNYALEESHANIVINIREPEGRRYSNNYRVNWHTPLDNAVETHKTTVTTMSPGMVTGSLPITGYTPTTKTKNDSLEVWVEPKWGIQEPLKGLSVNDWAVIGAALTLANGIGSTVATTLEFAAAVDAIPATIVALGLANKSWALTNLPKTEKQSCTNNFDAWQGAVNETLRAKSTPRDPIDQIRIDPPELVTNASIAELTHNDQNNWKQPGDPDPNKEETIWQLSTMEPWVKQTSDVSFYKGDDYNKNGYQGNGRINLAWPRDADVVAYYKFGVTPASP